MKTRGKYWCKEDRNDWKKKEKQKEDNKKRKERL